MTRVDDADRLLSFIYYFGWFGTERHSYVCVQMEYVVENMFFVVVVIATSLFIFAFFFIRSQRSATLLHAHRKFNLFLSFIIITIFEQYL